MTFLGAILRQLLALDLNDGSVFQSSLWYLRLQNESPFFIKMKGWFIGDFCFIHDCDIVLYPTSVGVIARLRFYIQDQAAPF